MSKKIITLKMEMDFEINESEITWVGGREAFIDNKGKQLNYADSKWPSVKNLLIHVLGKMIHGKNGEGELAIVNRLKKKNQKIDSL